MVFDISNKFVVNDNTLMHNNLKKDYYIEHGLILPKKPTLIGIRNCVDKVTL